MRAAVHPILRISALLAALGVAALPVEAGGEDGMPRLAAEELEVARIGTGDRLELAGVYAELQDRQLGLRQVRATFIVPNDRLRREVLSLDSLHETLVLHVECVAPDADQPVFRVLGVTGGPPLVELLRSDLERLDDEGKPPELLFRLARRILDAEAERRDAQRVELAVQAIDRWLARRDAELPADDVDARLQDLREVSAVVGDRRHVMRHLAALEKRFPRADEVRAELIGLGCRKYHGDWMTYEDFKVLQGYQRHRNRWVTKAEKEFLVAVESWIRSSRSDAILRHRLEREYQLLSSTGKTAVGMRAEEVAEALGFPDRVYRQQIRGREFTQWVYGDRFYYFVDGELFQSPDKES